MKLENKPKISVIVPIYKIPIDYFKKSFFSIINQNYLNYEVILVDDNNYGDMVSKEIDTLAEHYDNVYAYHQENSGVSVARNLGLEKSTGDWVMFVDPDDWLELNILDRLVDYIEDETDIVACSTFVNYKEMEVRNSFFNVNGKHSFENEEKDIPQLQLIAKGCNKYFPPEIGFGVPWARIYRKSMITNHQLIFLPNLKRMQDNVFNLYAFEYARKIVYIDEFLYHYRKDEGSASNAYQPNVVQYYEAVNVATKNFIKQFSKKPIFDVALSIKIVMGFHSYLNQYYYNKKYPYSRKQRNQEIKELLMSQYYSEALYKVDVKYLLRKEKVLFYFLKSQNTFMIRVLFFAEHTLRKLKRGNLKNEIK